MDTPRQGILVAGNMIVDQVKSIDRYPAPSALTTIREVTRSMGGLLCNCAVDLAKLDPSLPLQVIGVVGEDEAGDYILEELRRYPSIDTAGVRRQGGTSFTDVMTDQEGNRTFFQYRGANASLSPEDFDFWRSQARLLHLGYLLLLDSLDQPDADYPTGLCRVLAEAKAAGIQTSIDVVSEEGERFQRIVSPALAYTDYCCINELEAERVTGIPLRDSAGALLPANLPDACRALLDLGVTTWAVIHAPERSGGMDHHRRYVEEPSWPVPTGFKVSSVGAGDAFASGILYGAYHGWSLEQSIHVAGAIAAHSLSGKGASDAILPLPQLLARMESFRE